MKDTEDIRDKLDEAVSKVQKNKSKSTKESTETKPSEDQSLDDLINNI